jgi:hypothetical protein
MAVREYNNLIAGCGGRCVKYFTFISEEFSGRLKSPATLGKRLHPEWIPAQFIEYALENNGYSLTWRSRGDRPELPACYGSIRLLPIRTIFGDWKGHVYFGWPEEPARRRAFKVVDAFVGEACVGLYHDEHRDPGLYYYAFGEGEEPHPLHVDLKGYLRLLNYTMGYEYWQLAILSLLPDDGRNPVYRSEDDFTSRFRLTMSAWVPDFSYDEFVALFEEVKLSSYTPSAS